MDEKRTAGRSLSERILVRAPTGDDAALIAQILGEHGFIVVTVDDTSALAAEWEVGAGMVLIASEALNDPDCCTSLRELCDAQEPWSEIPVVLLGGGGEQEAAQVKQTLGERVQVLILDRPVGLATFVSATEAALRSRRRQYQVKRLLDELAESAVQIARAHEAADRAKDEFLATLAHELRSPMTAILGWAAMLKTADLDAAEATEALAMIEASTKVQAHIIEDLMDVSRIIAGKAMIAQELVELGPIVNNVVATFRAVSALEGIDLTVEIPPDRVFVFADAVRLQQVGWNLLSNALKFTPPGGSVHVALRRTDGTAEIRVRDTGRGMSSDLLPHVFERYRQESSTRDTPQRGLGLGLAIVRHLVDGHGGSIEAFSEGPGKGSEFVVSLPVAKADPPR
ncbi:MAG TPA: HAMP domain-containing sensor histidine kinase [Thermoanaerobaculia bacterium]|nr:HAMP domain-containing sensor histidine kinase [Thermoanaerobaculia bacterium]